MTAEKQGGHEWVIDRPKPWSPMDLAISNVEDVAVAPASVADPCGADDMRSDTAPRVGGCDLGRPGLFAAPKQVEIAIRHLHECLVACRGKADDKKRHALLQAWTAIQSDLGANEIVELRAALLEALFPEKFTPAPSRGRFPQQGGHSPCP